MERNINGLFVNIEGSENNRSIIFVHGFPFASWMWHNQINALSKDYRCIAYDVRGLGKSYVGDGQYTMEAYVDDLFMIMNELKLDKPVVCGLSMGGYIVLRALEREENYFSAAILLDTKPQADNDQTKLNRAAGINQINVEGLDKFVDTFVPDTFAEESRKDLKEIYNETIRRAKLNNPLGVKGALLAMLSRTSTESYLSKINIPVLSIVGNLDKLTPPQVMRNMSEKIPNGEFAIAPRSGHMTPLENPSFVNDLIRGFVNRNNA